VSETRATPDADGERAYRFPLSARASPLGSSERRR